ncbi:zinc-binding alcohol dehydrogenase family protein [Pendulispora albinea]|uniref:alcohol dehydrogenase n=1 Tax=Pendulispora albinea TaxID=2741071 RepID=A0ABZ2M2M1_9BACT
MRCMVLEQPGKSDEARADAETRATWLPLRACEREDPAPGPGEIVLEVRACAVCRTDLQLCEGDLALRRAPVVPGHQAVGRVVAVGEGVSDWRPGDRAGGAWLGGSCGACVHCLRVRENLCERAEFTGWDRDGGYATHLALRADFALRIPERFDDVEAAPLLCGGVIGYRSLMVSGIRPGGRLGLFGFGASALLVIQVAVHWGCEVFVCTRNPEERARARSLGAVWAGGYDAAPPAALDAAITFAPSGDVVVAALRALDRGGVVAINAIHLDRVPTFSYEHLWWERSVRSVANFTRDDARQFLALAAEIPIRTAVDVYPLAEANRALFDLARGNVRGAAVLTM